MVRYTLVPPARGPAVLDSVSRSVPDGPEAVDDCCAHICEQTTVQSRDRAREWLVFLQALGRVAESEEGFFRTEKAVDAERLAAPFETNIFGVSEVGTVLTDAAEPLDCETITERLDETVRERITHTTDESEQVSEYVERLLSWGVLFGSFTRSDGGYTIA